MATAKWKQFTEKELQLMAKESRSKLQWIEKMGYKPNGGSVTRVPKEILEKYPNLDISHFTGQGWLKNHNSYELLSHEYQGKRETIKNALIQKRGWKCEKCGLTEWNNLPIALEVHHINGNNKDNDSSNLLLLCPNCHSQTDNYRGKNINSKHLQISDADFIQALEESISIRQALLTLGLAPKGGNYDRAYKLCETSPVLIDKFLKK